uniref:Uncharacterized protein n=1 Tax=Arundo donax TaxID=35708 RepID=A0A0A9SES3_ARUDO
MFVRRLKFKYKAFSKLLNFQTDQKKDSDRQSSDDIR